MKRFMLVLALVAAAGATYVAMASGGQLAGPTAAEFKALKSQVAKLQKDETKVKGLAISEAILITDCMKIAVPIGRFGDTQGNPATYGYTYTDPNVNNGTPGFRPALDLTANNDPHALWMTGAPADANGVSACGTDINGALIRKVGRLAGVPVHNAAPLAFSAHTR